MTAVSRAGLSLPGHCSPVLNDFPPRDLEFGATFFSLYSTINEDTTLETNHSSKSGIAMHVTVPGKSLHTLRV